MYVLHPHKTFNGETSDARPAVIPPRNDSGRCTLCWTGDRNSDSLSVATVVGAYPDVSRSRIDPPKTILGEASSVAPALAYSLRTNRTYLAWIDSERRINVGALVTEDGGRSFFVSEDTRVRLPHSSDHAVALAAAPSGDRREELTEPGLFLAWIGRDAEHSINVMVSLDGKNFGWDPARAEGMTNLKTMERSHHSPALAWNRSGLQMAWTGTDGRINHMPLTTPDVGFPIEPQTHRKRTFQLSGVQGQLGAEARSSHGPALTSVWNRHQLVLGWTDSSSRINVLNLDHDGTVTEQTRLKESSIDGPQLADVGMGAHLAWTGIDGPRTINLGRLGRSIGDPKEPSPRPVGSPFGPGG